MFNFFVSGEKNQILADSPLWKTPLSGENTGFSSDIPVKTITNGQALTIGDYFLASRQFLSENDFAIVKKGLKAVYKKGVPADKIERINVFLEKHGVFYHPLKIQVKQKNSNNCSFVLNGAVSKPGLSIIENEYAAISRLNKSFSNRYLPQVFGVDIIKTDKGEIGFFLGEWFEGYKEFHATRDQDERSVVIWESDGSCNYLNEREAFPVYGEIARILTCYYNLETFEQIFPWHHAAGDFVVKIEKDKFKVRLITIRGYGSLTQFEEQNEDKKNHILPSLLFFFLNLTLRMRLDRLNGTGQPVMLGEKVLSTVVNGFLQGLDEKSPVYDYGDLKTVFISFSQQFDPEQIIRLFENILESTPTGVAESVLIRDNLESHSRFLHSILKNL